MESNRRILYIAAAGIALIAAAALVWQLTQADSDEVKNPAPVITTLGDDKLTSSEVEEYIDKGIVTDRKLTSEQKRAYRLQAVVVQANLAWTRQRAKELGIRVDEDDIERTKRDLKERLCGPATQCPPEFVYGWELTSEVAAYENAIQLQGKGYGYKPTQAELQSWYNSQAHLKGAGPFSEIRAQVETDFLNNNILKIATEREKGALEMIKDADFASEYEWMQSALIKSDGVPPPAPGFDEEQEPSEIQPDPATQPNPGPKP